MKKIIFGLLLITTLRASARPSEVLLGYTYGIHGITLQVASGGCTQKSDFIVEQRQRTSYQALTFYRWREDLCLALLPYGTMLNFSYEELGLAPGSRFQILNPVSSLSTVINNINQ
jgi:hypothetical protein